MIQQRRLQLGPAVGARPHRERLRRGVPEFRAPVQEAARAQAVQRGFSHPTLALPAVIRADVALSGELEAGRAVPAAAALTTIPGAVGVSPTNSRP